MKTLYIAAACLILVSRLVLAQQSIAFPNSTFSCENTLKYHVYFAGIKTGWLIRKEVWSESGGAISSSSYAGILGIGTRFEQHAKFVWNDQKGFVTTEFTQDVSGFKNREMTVDIAEGGHQSVMLVNQQHMQFTNPDRPILDVDTISAQLRYMLLQGVEQFQLTRQASDTLEHYRYSVEPQQTKRYSQWGELQVIPIKQKGADEVTMWFAPSMDYQLVDAKYHSMLLPGSMKLVDRVKTCD
ncbi:hypothetical protein [Vibrio sp. qd031]|uniref:hypothetical protein n=1 Tax=Vibrio sp. qd031 TaxID=1603038 RepID=UPI000A11B7A2|nr:hypothetical protein [Vibrio sp. qd031]